MPNIPKNAETSRTNSLMDFRQQRMQNITKQLRVIFRAVQAHSKTVERSCGLSGAKLWMLWELFASPGLKVSELARALTIHPSTCSNMLDQLEAQDLVRRDRSKKDQRAVHLYLTEYGTKLLADAPRPAQGTLSEALARLNDTHLVNLEDGLNQLIAEMHATDESAGMLPIPGE
ncbi:MarR family winged helix-turn-helix transcriptional regulator [Desulfogranum japonicum]|uniref:MarR family winged helix-turn-helix transcriptional regulator n=1 Tax=Desulfogranum japonicum TaxID=231447 RepID=UPI001E4E19A3|nr:MarR family transcriptional regulator [Desulfogranum japonicum]